jgi:hypothetical protein
VGFSVGFEVLVGRSVRVGGRVCVGVLVGAGVFVMTIIWGALGAIEPGTEVKVEVGGKAEGDSDSAF